MMPFIIEAAVRAAVLALIAAGVLRLARSAGLPCGPQVEKPVWTAVLAACLAMPWLMHAIAAPLIPAPRYLLEVVGVHLPLASHSPDHGFGLARVCTATYLLIASAALLRLAASLLYVWRLHRKAQLIQAPWTRGLEVRVSPQLPGPATFGRTILLPATHRQWPAFKREAVLAHERSHVLERDACLLWLAQLHVCVFWFSPLAWWLKRRLAVLAELTADDAALQSVGDRPGYAQILLELASPHHLRSTLSMSQQKHVAARIERVLSETATSRPRRRLMIGAAVLPAAVAAAALQLSATPAHAQQADPGAAEVPRIVSWGDLQQYYPAQARHNGIEGSVLLKVTVDSQGQPTAVQVSEEEPADQGFGAAALQLAPTMVYSNPSGQAAQLSFRVTFSLAATAHTFGSGPAALSYKPAPAQPGTP